MIEAIEMFTKLYNVAILAGACDTKARYFANKNTLKETKVNVIKELGMTSKSVPSQDEILFCIQASTGVTASDMIIEYPYIRLDDDELLTILESLMKDNLIELNDGFYRGVL